MPILQNIPATLDPSELAASGGQARVHPAIVRDAEDAIAAGESLWRPRAVYEWVDVLATNAEEVRVALTTDPAMEAHLRVGRKADLLDGARCALVAVGTIGPELEAHARELQDAGDGLSSYMLDSAGVMALGAVGEALRCLAEDEATALDWGVSAALSPGSLVGWSLRGQRELCSLLPLETIGVELNKHCVLEPHKSFSVLIGMGPSYASAEVGSVCKYCALQDTCWRRREDPS